MSWRNKENYKAFSVLVKKEITKINIEGNENVKTIFYKIKFIDSARFMESSLPNLADNLTEGIHKIKCNDCDCFLKYENAKNNFIKYKWLYCHKESQERI